MLKKFQHKLSMGGGMIFQPYFVHSVYLSAVKLVVVVIMCPQTHQAQAPLVHRHTNKEFHQEICRVCVEYYPTIDRGVWHDEYV